MADFALPNVALAALLARRQAHVETRGAAEERSTSRGKRPKTRAAMASGYGVNAPMGRCYPIFLSLSECAASSKNRDACDELRDDYMECLHHKKEVARLNAVTGERERKLRAGEPVPPTLAQDKAAGDLKLPWTKVK